MSRKFKQGDIIKVVKFNKAHLLRYQPGAQITKKEVWDKYVAYSIVKNEKIFMRNGFLCIYAIRKSGMCAHIFLDDIIDKNKNIGLLKIL